MTSGARREHVEELVLFRLIGFFSAATQASLDGCCLVKALRVTKSWPGGSDWSILEV